MRPATGFTCTRRQIWEHFLSLTCSESQPVYGLRFRFAFLITVTPTKCRPLLNTYDIIRRSLATVYVSSLLEAIGIARDDGKRPDGMSLIPQKMGQVLVWNVFRHAAPLPSSY
ncbi:hypothetical protein RR48_06418 [Papilio machaon]|uniref:Uncharacterized protein n=1 Tax=Papilio machaon TaxID=76193 RepID=A0A194R2M9_PAPMA|nr:hypothetical protein RR48_06418 [Papilio machaon]